MLAISSLAPVHDDCRANLLPSKFRDLLLIPSRLSFTFLTYDVVCRARYTDVEADATKLVQSFCEDPKKMGIDDFMRELLEFLKRFDRAQHENTARELKVNSARKL